MMDKRILLKIFALCCVYSVAETTKSIDDYCWRDYDGQVPADALIAGEANNDERNIYIGQTSYDNKVIPGKLYNNDKKLYFEYFNVEYSTENAVKILCTQHPGRFEWIPTRNTEVNKLTNKILIQGGFEPKCNTYLGRTVTKEGITPGKVMCCMDAGDCYGLYTSSDGIGYLHPAFQILTYNPNHTSPPDIPDIGHHTTNCKEIAIILFN